MRSLLVNQPNGPCAAARSEADSGRFCNGAEATKLVGFLMRKLMLPALAALLVTGLVPATAAAQAGEAPGAPGAHPSWLPANKTGFGTARGRASNVWFTLQGGQLSEVYYPDLSTPSVRSDRGFRNTGKRP